MLVPSPEEKSYWELPEDNSQSGTNSTKKQNKKTGIIVGVITVVVLVLIIIGMSVEKGAQEYDIDNETDTYMSESDSIATNDKKQQEESSAEFEIGTVIDGTYENKYLGVKCELDGWIFFDREQLMEATNMSTSYVAENVDDEAFLNDFKNAETFCDMKAFHTNGYTNVNIMVQKKLAADYSLLSEKTTMYAMAAQLPDYYKDMGVTIDVCEVEELDINGVTKYALYSTYGMSGMTAHTIQFIHMKSEHSATLTIVGDSNEECLSICNSVYFN